MTTRLKWILSSGATIFLLLTVAPVFIQREPARIAWTKANIDAHVNASSNYFVFLGKWPQSPQEFYKNDSNIVFFAHESLLKDGWQNPIIYEPYEGQRGYGRVLSFGRDGKEGGTGPDADIEVQFGK